jgi:hypothetical protein
VLDFTVALIGAPQLVTLMSARAGEPVIGDIATDNKTAEKSDASFRPIGIRPKCMTCPPLIRLSDHENNGYTTLFPYNLRLWSEMPL